VKLQDWQQAFKFVRGIARGVRRGQVFPAPGRVGVQAAPGGSRIVQTATPGGWNELGRWEITEHTIPVRGLSAALRVLHLSDVHLRRDEPWVNQLSGEILQMCAATPPDVIVLTGDVLARGFDMAVVHRFLGALPTARYGTYAVIGNWEYWALTPDGRSPHDPGYLGNESDQKAKRREEWTAVLAEHGIPLLNNRSVRVGPIRVAGTDDILAGDPDIAAAYAELDGTPTLTLTHSPAMFDDLSHPDVFAVLAGHTHAGQVRLPVVGPFFLPKGSGDYPWGWYQGLDGAWLFVHRGIGWSVAPVRWRAAPEIAWIMVKPT
jgi:hypothetical protein